MLLAAVPSAALAAPPTVSTPSSPVTYVEQAPPVAIGESVTLSGGSGYGGGYVDFGVVGGTSDETLSLLSAATADTTAGAVTIVGSTVYLGNGSGADVIGSVDPDRSGANGALRIDFVSPFTNPSFEGGSTIQGWTAIQNRVDLGVTSIAGFTSIDQSTYAGIAGGSGYSAPADDNAAPSNATYTVRLNTASASDGSTSLELTSNMTTAEGCDVVHGPAVYSDPFEASQNDKIYFDWRAFQGADNFHVYGYILNTVTGTQTPVLNATGGNEVNAFVTKETVIPASGTYRFVFVGGTQDRTCGMAAGATLLIDNVRVYGTKVNDAVVTALADKVRYQNVSDDPAATRTIAVTAADGNGTVSAAGNVQIAITAVDDDPTFASVAPITLTNTEGPQSYATTTGQLNATDPDSPITSSIVGGTTTSTTIAGVTYTQSLTGTYGTLYLEQSTGKYAFVPDAAAADARTTDDSESFRFRISAPDLSPGGPHPDKTVDQTLAVTLDVPDDGPGSPATSAAIAGDESATVSWTTPAWDSGSPITGYRIEVSTDGGTTWTTAVADTGTTSTSATVGGLAAGTAAVFRVAGINANGTGSWGPTSDPVTPYTTADAPTPVSATPGDASVQLAWTAPASDGWSAVTGYRIEQSLDGGATWTTVTSDTGSTGTTYAVTGLANGTPASFRVAALNAAGPGAWATAGPTTPTTVPGTPRNLAATPGDGRVALQWNAPADDGGTPITGYRVEQSLDGGATWTIVTADTGSTATQFDVTGLANGTAVSFRVAAINATGTGAGATVDTSPRRAPGAVTVDKVTATNRTLTVSFTPPTDDGGSPVTGYEYSLDGGVTWQSAGTTNSPLVIEGLVNGKPYSVVMRAVNAAGAGDPSSATSASPVLAPVAKADGTLPTARPGSSASTLGGTAETVDARPDGDSWLITGDGFQLRITSLDADGHPVALSGGALVVPVGGSVQVTGTGFLPSSAIDIWLLDGRIHLGDATTDADGAFAATLLLPAGVRIGPDTLQVNGLSPRGSLRSVVTGLTVISADDLAATGASLSASTMTAVGAGAGLVLLVGTAAFVFAWRRRRGETPTS